MLVEYSSSVAESLMVLETPLLRVSRPVAACQKCRTAKTKCDGKLPACTACERGGKAAECSSTNDQFAKGKERSYVATLEARVDRLQHRIHEARARKSSVISLFDEDSSVPSRRLSADVSQAQRPSVGRAASRKEASAMDDLVSDFGFLAVNATARDYYGFTSAMSYARLVLSACSKDPLPEGTTKALPPRHEALKLIQHYMDNMFILLPLFEEASFFLAVDNTYHSDRTKASAFDTWNVRMVLAIACASKSRDRGDAHYLDAVMHVTGALANAEQVLRPGSTLSVQALLLLVEYSMLDPHHFDSWSLVGAASRAMVDLGLHQDPPRGTQMTKAKLELRRRLYYCVYALDRSTSMVQSRAFSFSDDSANVKAPFGSSTSSLSTTPSQPLWRHSFDSARALFKLRQLQSAWYTALFQTSRVPWPEPYPYIWKTCQELKNWFDTLSPLVQTNMRSFFELELLYSFIYVLSPNSRVPVIHPHAQTLMFEYCIDYASKMQSLLSDPNYTAPLTFHDAMRVYMVGRHLLDVLNQEQERILSGIIPPPPAVPSDSPGPPPLPLMQQHASNTARSVTCIKQITDILGRFGERWGYHLRRDRFQKDSENTLMDLEHRRRTSEQGLSQYDTSRRESMYDMGHRGSIYPPSSAGLSPPYQQPSPSYGFDGQQRHSSSPLYQLPNSSGYPVQQQVQQQQPPPPPLQAQSWPDWSQINNATAFPGRSSTPPPGYFPHQ